MGVTLEAEPMATASTVGTKMKQAIEPIQHLVLEDAIALGPGTLVARHNLELPGGAVLVPSGGVVPPERLESLGTLFTIYDKDESGHCYQKGMAGIEQYRHRQRNGSVFVGFHQFAQDFVAYAIAFLAGDKDALRKLEIGALEALIGGLGETTKQQKDLFSENYMKSFLESLRETVREPGDSYAITKRTIGKAILTSMLMDQGDVTDSRLYDAMIAAAVLQDIALVNPQDFAKKHHLITKKVGTPAEENHAEFAYERLSARSANLADTQIRVAVRYHDDPDSAAKMTPATHPGLRYVVLGNLLYGLAMNDRLNGRFQRDGQPKARGEFARMALAKLNGLSKYLT